jgi:prepilin peptidase CpaA
MRIEMSAADPARNSQRRLAWLLAFALPALLGLGIATIQGLLRSLAWMASLYAAILFLLLAVCTWTDLTRKRIPNWATYPAFVWAVFLNAFGSLVGPSEGMLGQEASVHVGPVGLGQCLAGASVCFAIMFFIFRLAGGGAGDVKLATAIGGLLGLERGLNVLVVSYLLAGTVIVCWVIWTVGPLILLKSFARKIGSLLLPLWVMPPTAEQTTLLRHPVPLAVFFALGTVAVVGGLTIPW